MTNNLIVAILRNIMKNIMYFQMLDKKKKSCSSHLPACTPSLARYIYTDRKQGVEEEEEEIRRSRVSVFNFPTKVRNKSSKKPLSLSLYSLLRDFVLSIFAKLYS